MLSLSRVIEAIVVVVPLVLVAGFGRFGSAAEGGAPAVRTPVDPDEVLITVPIDPERVATAETEAELRTRPTDPRLAAYVARRHIEDARRNNDPRALGWAEAALAPWATDPAPPTEILLLRATIRQSRHYFAEALVDLGVVLGREPTHAQAALTRATVLSVIGRAAEARADCDLVARKAQPIVAAACHANLDGLLGEAEAGRARLDAALGVAAPDGLVSWALGIRGELDGRLGDRVLAERDLRAALDKAPGDGWTIGALSDLLLDLGRPAEVLPLVAGSDADNLVLRRALARQALAATSALSEADRAALDADITTLRGRFAAAYERQDAQHQREESRFVLGIDHDAAKALTLAESNWQHQKEPIDARIFLEAAGAAEAPARAEPVLQFIARTHLRDAAIDAQRQRLARPE